MNLVTRSRTLRHRLSVGALLLGTLASAATAGTPPTIPLHDFFKNPESVSYELSPDGKYLAYQAPYENRLNIFVRPVNSTKATRITSETSRDIAGFLWKGNDHILFVRDFGGDENYHVFSVDRSGKGVKDLTPFEGVRAQFIDDLEEDADEILVGLNKRNPQVYDAYRLNVLTGELKMVAENPGNISGWITDHDGRLRVATATDGVNSTLLYREKESDQFRPVLTTNFKEGVSPMFFTFDNKYLYAGSNLGRDKMAIVKFDIANGKEMEVIYEHPDVDVANLSYSKKRKELTSISYVTWKTQRKFLSKESETTYNRLASKFPNYEVSMTSSNKDEDVYVVRTSNDRTMGSYYLYQKKEDKLTKLVDVSPWIRESDMAEMKPISYTSRDGYTINGYLTVPKGQEAKNLPVVVNPHGGPWARDQWGFNPEVQFLANRGYAVLQINFRGSTGYGRKFLEASFKEWGKSMQDDITDGVGWLIKEGIADPKRVGIYGASYGGYATLAGLTFTPDLYACGVDYVGVSNLFTFLGTIPPYWKPYLDMFHEMVGDPVKDSLLFVAASPIFHVDRIKAPLLVLQGAKDPRVNINESDQIVNALKKRGVAVEYIVKENEGHGFSNEENRFAAYEAIEKFLDRHLKTAN